VCFVSPSANMSIIYLFCVDQIFLSVKPSNRKNYDARESTRLSVRFSPRVSKLGVGHVVQPHVVDSLKLSTDTHFDSNGGFMKRRSLLCAVMTGLLAALQIPIKPDSGLEARPANPSPRPNIVLIVADDLGFSDLGSYGGEIRTPNLDQLATSGMRFTQFYNNAVCVVTRASMMTGLYPRFGSGGFLRNNMITLAELLQQADYHTVLTGKWHLGNTAPNRPTDRGFEEYYGVPSGACNYFNPAQPDPRFYDGVGKRRPFVHNTRPVDSFPEDFYTTDAFTDHAVQQIGRLARSGKPFFLNVAYTAPHFPLQAKPEDVARYQGKYSAGYIELRRQRYHRQLKLGILNPNWQLSEPDTSAGIWNYDYAIVPWESVRDQDRQQRLMEVYAAMVDRLDQGIGRILQALKDQGIQKSTLVLFFSDNGGCASLPVDREGYQSYNKGKIIGTGTSYEFCGPGWGWAQNTPFRRYKAWTYEGGIATPFIASWPTQIRPGTVTHQVAHVIDLLPSLAELAGARYPTVYQRRRLLPFEGTSLWPVLKGGTRPAPELSWFLLGNRAIRQGRWKLVWGLSKRQWELYDLEQDRTETHDLAAMYPERASQLERSWRRWANRSEVLTLKNPESGSY